MTMSVTLLMCSEAVSTWNNRIDVSRSSSVSPIRSWNFCCKRLRQPLGKALASTCPIQPVLHWTASTSSHKFLPVGLLCFLTDSLMPGQGILAASVDCDTFNEQHSVYMIWLLPSRVLAGMLPGVSSALHVLQHTHAVSDLLHPPFPASSPRVNLRTEDQPHLPALLSNTTEAENLAIFHLQGFLQSPLQLTISKLTLDNSAPSNTTHHHRGEMLYPHTNPCIP